MPGPRTFPAFADGYFALFFFLFLRPPPSVGGLDLDRQLKHRLRAPRRFFVLRRHSLSTDITVRTIHLFRPALHPKTCSFLREISFSATMSARRRGRSNGPPAAVEVQPTGQDVSMGPPAALGEKIGEGVERPLLCNVVATGPVPAGCWRRVGHL